jgi:hypothetical protein
LEWYITQKKSQNCMKNILQLVCMKLNQSNIRIRVILQRLSIKISLSKSTGISLYKPMLNVLE